MPLAEAVKAEKLDLNTRLQRAFIHRVVERTRYERYCLREIEQQWRQARQAIITKIRQSGLFHLQIGKPFRAPYGTTTGQRQNQLALLVAQIASIIGSMIHSGSACVRAHAKDLLDLEVKEVPLLINRYLGQALQEAEDLAEGIETVLYEYIIKVKGGYRVISHQTGKNLGTFPSRAAARRRLRQLARFREQFDEETLQDILLEYNPYHVQSGPEGGQFTSAGGGGGDAVDERAVNQAANELSDMMREWHNTSSKASLKELVDYTMNPTPEWTVAIQRTLDRLPWSADGTVTLYRGGSLEGRGKATSWSTDREWAGRFATYGFGKAVGAKDTFKDVGQIHEQTFKRDDLLVALPWEGEVLVRNSAVKKERRSLKEAIVISDRDLLQILLEYNPNHVPSGPEGGQFTGSAASGSRSSKESDAIANFALSRNGVIGFINPNGSIRSVMGGTHAGLLKKGETYQSLKASGHIRFYATNVQVGLEYGRHANNTYVAQLVAKAGSRAVFIDRGTTSYRFDSGFQAALAAKSGFKDLNGGKKFLLREEFIREAGKWFEDTPTLLEAPEDLQPLNDLNPFTAGPTNLFPPPAVAADVTFSSIPVGAITHLLRNPLGGEAFAASFADMGTALLTRLKNTLMSGLLRGTGVGGVTKQVQGVLDNTKWQAERIVRSEFGRVTNQAALAQFDQNKELLNGVQWVATLDDRTCLECGDLDGEVYDDPADAPVPVVDTHPNCRCTLVPVVKDAEELGLDAVGPGTRASMNGQVPATQTYDEWFGNQSPTLQSEILGPTRYRLWSQNKIELSDFVSSRGIRSVKSVLQSLGEAVEELSEFNPYHVQSGPEGGQFTSGDGEGEGGLAEPTNEQLRDYIKEISSTMAARLTRGEQGEMLYVLSAPRRMTEEVMKLAYQIEHASSRQAMLDVLESQMRWTKSPTIAPLEWAYAEHLGVKSIPKGIDKVTLSKDQIKAFDARTTAIQNWARANMLEPGASTVSLYRGIRGAQSGKLRKDGAKEGSTVDLGVYGLSSWADNRSGAQMFAMGGGKAKGMVLKTTDVPIKDIFLLPRSFGPQSVFKFSDDHGETVLLTRGSKTRSASVYQDNG